MDTKRLRFSLRSLLIFVTLTGLLVALGGISRVQVLRHYQANAQLKQIRATRCNGFEDPIGPNFFYGWKIVPSNGAFPKWFVQRFCITGYTDCQIEDLSGKPKVWKSLSDLFNLNSLAILNCRPHESFGTNISKCRSLTDLVLRSTPLSGSDIQQISKLPKLEHLTIIDCHVEEPRKLVALSEIATLKSLSIKGDSVNDSLVRQLSLQMPKCDIKTRQE